MWTLIDAPIKYTPNPSGYSSAMLPLGDGREILQLVNVTRAGSDGQAAGAEIQYVKFKLPATLPALEFPFAPRGSAPRPR